RSLFINGLKSEPIRAPFCFATVHTKNILHLVTTTLLHLLPWLTCKKILCPIYRTKNCIKNTSPSVKTVTIIDDTSIWYSGLRLRRLC
ncbi:MAG: hypothetical protein WBQ73_04275, partial [Candidatus Babeliales bacterium]